MKVENIILNFQIKGKLVSIKPTGNGHINTTFVAVFSHCGKTKKYILQEINTAVFPNVDDLMNNIVGVTDYLKGVIERNGGDVKRETLSVVLAKDGKSYIQTGENKYFRVYNFIENTVCYEQVETPEQFYELAKAFGNFANLLVDFNASSLKEVLPNFHNTLSRYYIFEKALKDNISNRKDLIKDEIEFALSRKEYAERVVKLIENGKIPVRVTHNDTKLNNVMFDADTKKPICIVDLDTIMPGSILYDFGDAVRFGCSTAPENEKDLSKVNFNFELFKIFAKGYVESLHSITETEKANLAFSAILITYELGLRFLTDYLNGDTYFHIDYESENLDRTRTQFKLVTEMEKMLPQMEEYVNSLKV